MVNGFHCQAVRISLMGKLAVDIQVDNQSPASDDAVISCLLLGY